MLGRVHFACDMFDILREHGAVHAKLKRLFRRDESQQSAAWEAALSLLDAVERWVLVGARRQQRTRTQRRPSYKYAPVHGNETLTRD